MSDPPPTIEDMDEERDLWIPDPPDAVSLVVEVADMEAVFAAQRLVRINQLRLEALDDVTRYGGGSRELVERSLRLELASALRITENVAGMLLARAEALVHRYPTVLASLGCAGMTERHAQILVDGLDTLEPDAAARLVERARELAESLPIGSFRRALRRLIDTARAATRDERTAQAIRQRRVVIEPTDDGMAWLYAYLPAIEAHAIHGRITAMAAVIAANDTERSLDEVRADVLCDLLIDGAVGAHPSDARGIRPTVVVTVPALALLDVDAASEPASVEGIGPIPIERARQLCGGSSSWMRVLTHPETGAVLSVGRTRYRPPPELAKLVKWRAQRCMAPGCGMPASRCQIDHTIAWEHGGATEIGNLAPMCQGHHTIKHHGGWTVRQRADGCLEWNSPSGRQYVVAPERILPAFAPAC